MNACEKKSKSLLEKPDIRYPATSKSGFSKPGYPGIRYLDSKSVSGTTLLPTYRHHKHAIE